MSTVYEIGPFRLDPEAGVLVRAGLPVQLGGRAIAVLTALVKKPNKFVPKEAILDVAWPDVVVEESNLAVQISAIRRALAAVPGGQHWIETLARRGYRFVGPVTEVSDGPPEGPSGERESSNLPEQLTSFIGRERELVEIKRLLPSNRLLTLVGMGGIGKTRLALQAAAEVLAAYRDGVWLVDLAPLSDPALVPRALAQVLAVREAVGKPLVETLCFQLERRELLLVLDNCEHLLEGCAKLADALLRHCPGVQILATSREALGISGEQTYQVPSLSLPDPQHVHLPVSVSEFEAVRLFIDRASLARADFQVTTQNASALASCAATAGRHSAGHRVSGDAGAVSFDRTDRQQAGPSFPPVDRRLTDGIAPSEDAARAHRLELRPANRTGETATAAAIGVCRRVDFGSGGAGLRRRGH